MKRIPLFRSTLKFSSLFVGYFLAPALIIFAEYSLLERWVTRVLGAEIGKNGFFQFAAIAFSIIIYLMLMVFTMRAWEEIVRDRLKAKFKSIFKQRRKDRELT